MPQNRNDGGEGSVATDAAAAAAAVPGDNGNQERINKNLEKFLNMRNNLNQQQRLQVSIRPQHRRQLQQQTSMASSSSPSRRVRLGSVRGNQTVFAYGNDVLLDRAIEMLEPDLRPVPPQPNCPQSMKIYEDHRLLAADFLDTKKETLDAERYKSDLMARLEAEERKEAAEQSAFNLQPRQEDVEKLVRLQSEKEALLQFQEKLSTQLQLIKKAQNKQVGPPAAVPSASAVKGAAAVPDQQVSAPNSKNLDDGWVIVQKDQQQQQQQKKQAKINNL